MYHRNVDMVGMEHTDHRMRNNRFAETYIANILFCCQAK